MMKRSRGIVTGIVVILFIITAVLASSQYQKSKARGEFAERIFSQGNDSPPDTIGELKNAIAAYERQIEQHVQDAVKNGTYWKILAVRLQDSKLHSEALKALEQAIYYSPEDPALHYYTGLSAGTMAKSLHSFPEQAPGPGGSGREFSESGSHDREKYFILAEQAYLRAIELDERYLRPRYGLAVLYVFELERPEDAVPHLERYLEISRNDVDIMFVLARAYYMLRNYEAAVNLYDRIITLTTDEQKRTDAQNNRQTVMGQMYG